MWLFAERKKQVVLPRGSVAYRVASARGRKGNSGKTAVSRSSEAGLAFLVGRITRYLKKGKYAERVGAGAPVNLAAVLEYLVTETRIVPRHIKLAVRNDEELSKLLGHVTIALGGVLHSIQSVLMPKKSTKRGLILPVLKKRVMAKIWMPDTHSSTATSSTVYHNVRCLLLTCTRGMQTARHLPQVSLVKRRAELQALLQK
ncbi:hypothetical protein QJQ45_000067 [Haematococcus lacustris]|nr:hypothetical protein QJQ45_000067 [Haematococcus lacustris]